MSDPFVTPSLKHSHIAMPEVREQSASVIQIETSKLMPALLFIGLLAGAALAVSIVSAINSAERARLVEDAVAERQRITERETRIMQDDLKYIRSYLSARGISIPANHEEAEE